VPEPKIQEIEAAAKNLSLQPEVVPDRAVPRTWWQKSGYVVAEKKDETRATVLKSIAKEIAKQRK
jgi:signal recognition particle subunit SEC65